MKFARLFLATLLLCIFLSAISSILMVKYVWWDLKMRNAIFGTTNVVGESLSSETSKIQQNQDTSSEIKADQSLASLESSVKTLASKASPSVVSIVINKEVQTYRTDPFGFFYEPAGTVKQKVWGGTGFFVSKDGYSLINSDLRS